MFVRTTDLIRAGAAKILLLLPTTEILCQLSPRVVQMASRQPGKAHRGYRRLTVNEG